MTAPDVRPARPADRNQLAAMRALLWPDAPPEELASELDAAFSGAATSTLPVATFVACDADGALLGFIEAGLRSHADGCDTTHPVGFIEGWFVHEHARNRGIGRALVRAAEDWARTQGCREMASDTWIDHEPSQRAHQALGFEIVDRCIHFRKRL